MKKIISLSIAIVSALMMLCFGIHAYAATKDVKTDVPPNMVFLGDSIATGFGLEGYEKGKENCSSYSNTLYEKYSEELDGKCKTSMKNYAIDGQTSSGLLEKLSSGTYDDSLKNADAVIVSIGGNDLLSVIKNLITNDLNLNVNKRPTRAEIADIINSITSFDSKIDKNLDAFDSNISEIAKYIKSKSNAVLVVQTLYNPFEKLEQKQTNEFVRKKILSLNSSIESHKNDDNAEYIVADVYSEFYGKADELTRINEMDIHPTQKGHDKIAECIDKSIRMERYSYSTKPKESPAQSNTVSESNPNIGILLYIGIMTIIFVIIVVLIILKHLRKKQDNP